MGTSPDEGEATGWAPDDTEPPAAPRRRRDPARFPPVSRAGRALSRAAGPHVRRTPLALAFGAVLFSFGLSLAVNSPQLNRVAFGEAVNNTVLFTVDYVLFFYAAVSVMGAARRHLEFVLR